MRKLRSRRRQPSSALPRRPRLRAGSAPSDPITDVQRPARRRPRSAMTASGPAAGRQFERSTTAIRRTAWPMAATSATTFAVGRCGVRRRGRSDRFDRQGRRTIRPPPARSAMAASRRAAISMLGARVGYARRAAHADLRQGRLHQRSGSTVASNGTTDDRPALQSRRLARRRGRRAVARHATPMPRSNIAIRTTATRGSNIRTAATPTISTSIPTVIRSSAGVGFRF